MKIRELAQAYPYCHHVTFTANFSEISRSGVLLSARTLMLESGHADLVPTLRRQNLTLKCPRSVTIRNQRAIKPQNLELPGITLGDYISYLNSRTYFFPGGARPSASAIWLWRKSDSDSPSIILRIPTLSLIEANIERELLVADCSVGATWSESRTKITRRTDEFQCLSIYAGPPSRLVELSMLECTYLPDDTAFAMRPDDIWTSLRKREAVGR
jgi:hypothetical protein